MPQPTVKSWRDVVDRQVAQQPFRLPVLNKFNDLKARGIPLPQQMIDEIQSALRSPHLTEEGTQNLLDSLKFYESEFNRTAPFRKR